MSENLKKIQEFALHVFGDEIRAKDWIEKQSATLGDSPNKLSETEEGTKKVLLHLRQIERHVLD